ncbi:10498_t:CDS:1, partial [Funneliformis caledonium]
DTNKSKLKKVHYYCDKCKGCLVDPRTEKKHNLRKNIRPRGIIKNIVLNRGFLNNPSQDILVNPLNDPIEVDTSSNNSDQIIKPIQPIENYSFLFKKLPKGESKGK